MSSTNSHAAASSRRAAGVLLAFWIVLATLAAGLSVAASPRAAAQATGQAVAYASCPVAGECGPPTSTSTPIPSPTVSHRPPISPTPVPTWAPLAPNGLWVTGTASSSVSLVWAESLHATSYELERAVGATGEFEKIATTHGRSWTDVGLTPDTRYRYRVRGVNLNGSSPYSMEVSATPRSSTCPVTVTATSTWDGGYVLDVTVTNSSTMTFYSWQSSVTLPDGHTVQASWPGTSTVSGQTVTQRSQSWNSSLAPGQTASWGMHVSRPAGDRVVPVTATCVVAVPVPPPAS